MRCTKTILINLRATLEIGLYPNCTKGIFGEQIDQCNERPYQKKCTKYAVGHKHLSKTFSRLWSTRIRSASQKVKWKRTSIGVYKGYQYLRYSIINPFKVGTNDVFYSSETIFLNNTDTIIDDQTTIVLDESVNLNSWSDISGTRGISNLYLQNISIAQL